jgi:hypothetical protein
LRHHAELVVDGGQPAVALFARRCRPQRAADGVVGVLRAGQVAADRPVGFAAEGEQPQRTGVAGDRRELRTSERSLAARHKATTRRTEDDLPLHSFRSLLRDLTTLVLNKGTVPTNPNYTFNLLTKPTPLQARAFELLALSPLL